MLRIRKQKDLKTFSTISLNESAWQILNITQQFILDSV